MPDTLCTYYSGVLLNQNAVAESTLDTIALASLLTGPGVPTGPSLLTGGGSLYQQFRLPVDVERGDVSPSLTGVQVRVSVGDLDAQLTIGLEHRAFLGGWTPLAEAVTTSPPVADSEVWLTCLFDAPVSLDGILNDDFRIHIFNATGVNGVWYTVPNPYASIGGAKLYLDDGSTSVLDSEREVSANFRVLAGVADSGVDFLGNQYRSLAVRRSVTNASPTASQDTTWLSGPQPSKFAVVSQYYDMQDAAENPAVIDSVTIDPTTPGMWVHAYYCNDGDPGTTDEEWEERVWTPIPRSYQALRRDTFIFPEPVHARYIKLEYSHLQARAYSPGALQRPIQYKKHPKWVLDYFLLATQDAQNAISDGLVARNVTVEYNAYSLAYTYYQDDLGRDVAPPPFLTPEDKANVENFVSTPDQGSAVDATTQSQIATIMQPYLFDARSRAVARSLIGDSLTLDNSGAGYPVESIASPTPVSTAVSSLDRENVIFEKSFPVMFFYVAARHRYRVVSATLANDRAYFAGVREVAFSRERYSVESDAAVYTETLGDYFNAERNDFVSPSLPSLP